MKKIIWFPVLGAFFSRWNMFADSNLYMAYWRYQFFCLTLVSIWTLTTILFDAILGK